MVAVLIMALDLVHSTHSYERSEREREYKAS